MRKPSSLLPRRPARKTGTRERTVGSVILLLLGAGLTLFILAGGRAGPPSLVAGEAPVVASPYALTSAAGWPRGAVEHYDVDGLFEKINGKADAYIAFDVVDLTFVGYSDPKDPEVYVDVYVYDMAESLNAYGIYRSQRSGKEQALEVGEEGCSSGSAFFARKGRHYLEVVGSSAQATAEARAILDAVLAALPAGAAPVGDPDWFPAAGRTRILYARSNALGVESLTDAFLARYDDGARALVARLGSPEEAEAARSEALETFEFLGTPAHVVVEGAFVVGAVDAQDEGRRTDLVAAIVKRIQEAP